MSARKPRLTVEQYREGARTLQVAVSEAAWSLVVSPSSVDFRRWRPLTAVESEALFDRLMLAVTRFNNVDRAIVGTKAHPVLHGTDQEERL